VTATETRNERANRRVLTVRVLRPTCANSNGVCPSGQVDSAGDVATATTATAVNLVVTTAVPVLSTSPATAATTD
jgi:hypothetical protein